MSRKPIALAALLAWPIAASASIAQEAIFTCPLDAFAGYRDPGVTAPLTIAVHSGEPGSVELRGPWGDIALPATQISIQEATLFAEATSAVEMRMPDRDAVDACIAQREQEQPRIMKSRQDADVIRTCLGTAPLTDEPVAVDLAVAIIATDRSQAQAIITRSYVGEEGEAAKRHGAQTMAACTAAQP
jgi:hypothetical protein